jgi:hypothetical protein
MFLKLKNMKKIIYLVLTAALICGCSKDNTESIGSIYGVITDKATGEPIQSAGVQLNPSGTQTVTGSEGQYEFIELKAGSYSINVTKTGYTDLVNYKITVAAGTTNKGDVQLEKLPPSLRVVNDNKQNIDELDFGDAADDVTRSFSIFNDGPISLEWQLTETSEWITAVSKTDGKLNAGATQAVIIIIDREKLAGGDNTTTIQVTSNNGSKQLTVKAIGETRTLPTLNTLDVTDITSSTAIFHGVIVDAGVPVYTERGFVYSTASMPTLENTIAKPTVAVTEDNEYSVAITNLADQTYYVRAYAVNKTGTAYSTNEVSFTTVMTLPRVTTQAVTNRNISAGAATFNGTIVSVGDPAYTERGFVYGITHNPTVDDTKKPASGTGTGAFSFNLTGLSEGNTYYVRAYATNNKETAYGEEVIADFSAVMPVVTTHDVSDIDGTSVRFNGSIETVGDPAYIERGFVYGTMPSPTIEDGTKNPVSGTSTGEFSANISGLTIGITYYVRAYAINIKGTTYGVSVNFKPESPYYVVLTTAGIMVQKQDLNDIYSITWTNANNLCENSTVGGYTDWRLPTIEELTVMYNERDAIGGFNTDRRNYWSSTLDFQTDGHKYYKQIGFGSGAIDVSHSDSYSAPFDYFFNARAVRSLP